SRPARRQQLEKRLAGWAPRPQLVEACAVSTRGQGAPLLVAIRQPAGVPSESTVSFTLRAMRAIRRSLAGTAMAWRIALELRAYIVTKQAHTRWIGGYCDHKYTSIIKKHILPWPVTACACRSRRTGGTAALWPRTSSSVLPAHLPSAQSQNARKGVR